MHFPVLYWQGHFGLHSPAAFSTEPENLTPERKAQLDARHEMTGYDFYQHWIARDFPRA